MRYLQAVRYPDKSTASLMNLTVIIQLRNYVAKCGVTNVKYGYSPAVMYKMYSVGREKVLEKGGLVKSLVYNIYITVHTYSKN